MIIIGAGMAAQAIARQIADKQIFGSVQGFVSETETYPPSVMNLPVFGNLSELPRILAATSFTKAIIALEHSDRKTIRDIYIQLKQAAIPNISILPDATRLEDAEAHLIQTREIRTEDLLSRDPVKLSLKESLHYLRGKRVLITGAGGSIGRELCRQLLFGGAQRLYLFDHCENNVYEIDKELRLLQEEGVGEKAVIVPIVGELQDSDYMHFLLKRLKANVIFHTAAYKQVPLMEENPVEVVKNNLFGTSFLVNAAIEAQTDRLVFISTDKAVEPGGIYGISKLLCEQFILKQAVEYNRNFMVVRFGNVLGSQGSIVPLFQKQIAKGGPVTLTHPDIDRFFMTIPEASGLVLQAGGTGTPGNLYILNMGTPIKIMDLAKQMIEFYGFEPESEIKIKTIGLRKGEKLHERLWEATQTLLPTDNPMVNRLQNPIRSDLDVPTLLNRLKPVCFLVSENPHLYRNRIALKKILAGNFPQIAPTEQEPQY